jgi:UDP-N-acetylglucosamine--N-acetylmuramyl-(pentapeptide) pyrophosphoryl-undecaprenol N-acetylglucosamine transferase
MSAAPHVLFTGGGVGGHLAPGLAVAAELSKRMPHVLISCAGPGRSSEQHFVRSAGYQYLTIPSRPSPLNPIQAVRFVTDNVAGYCAARWMLREHKVSLVVGMGGYTSTAIVRAAAARGTPIVLLEQNAVPGRTTRWLSRSSALVCVAFEESRPHLHVQAPVTVTGNPVRLAVEQFYRRLQQTGSSFPTSHEGDAAAHKKRLVVLGGADGARSLNESIPGALKQLGPLKDDWQVIHQTGDGQLQETEARYHKLGVEALAVTSIEEIASVLFASDLVVCRAGGTTLAELALAGVPALLVPSPQAIDDHQIANAKVFTAAGACRLIDETSQTGALDTALASELKPLVCDGQLRHEMGLKMQSLARPQASADIASAIQETICGARTELLAA